MSQNGIDKYYDGSVVISDTMTSKNVVTDKLNGTEVGDLLTKQEVPNPNTLKQFNERGDGLYWRDTKLIPPSEIMEDRPYGSDEISDMVERIWDKYDGSTDEDNKHEVVTPGNPPSGTNPSDWKNS